MIITLFFIVELFSKLLQLPLIFGLCWDFAKISWKSVLSTPSFQVILKMRQKQAENCISPEDFYRLSQDLYMQDHIFSSVFSSFLCLFLSSSIISCFLLHSLLICLHCIDLSWFDFTCVHMSSPVFTCLYLP